MGQPKGLLEFRGSALVMQHVSAFRRVAAPVIVVLGHRAQDYKRILPRDIKTIINDDWAHTHPADSLRAGLRLVAAGTRCLVTPVDVPPPPDELLQRLLSTAGSAVPTDRVGRPGHPVLLSVSVVDQVRLRAPEGGLRTLLTKAELVRTNSVDLALDFDHPEEWQAWLSG